MNKHVEVGHLGSVHSEEEKHQEMTVDDFEEDNEDDFDEDFTLSADPISFKLEVQAEPIKITKRKEKAKSPNQMTEEEFKASYLNYF